MSILQSKTTQYSFSPDQIRQLIAADLGKKVEDIKVNFVVQNTADDRWGGISYDLTNIEVTVKG
jgi:hypothetical protein